MNKCYLTNCNRGIGTISKKQDIKTIYHGDLQNGYDKGDLFDANAVIDQIKKHGGESGGESSDRILKLIIDYDKSPTKSITSSEDNQSIYKTDSIFIENPSLSIDPTSDLDDFSVASKVTITITNIPEEYELMRALCSSGITLNICYRYMGDNTKYQRIMYSDVYGRGIYCVFDQMSNNFYLEFTEYNDTNRIFRIDLLSGFEKNVSGVDTEFDISDHIYCYFNWNAVYTLNTLTFGTPMVRFLDEGWIAPNAGGGCIVTGTLNVDTNKHYDYTTEIYVYIKIPHTGIQGLDVYEGHDAVIYIKPSVEDRKKVKAYITILSKSSSADLNWNEL